MGERQIPFVADLARDCRVFYLVRHQKFCDFGQCVIELLGESPDSGRRYRLQKEQMAGLSFADTKHDRPTLLCAHLRFSEEPQKKSRREKPEALLNFDFGINLAQPVRQFSSTRKSDLFA